MRVSVWTLVLLLTASTVNAREIRYTTGWNDGWKHVREDDACVLSIPALDYGEARFVSRPDEKTFFEFQARRDLQSGPLSVWRVAPGWHPQPAESASLGSATHVPGGGSVSVGELADDMLLSLRDGYHVELKAASTSRASGQLTFAIKAMNFRPAYDEFLACAQTTLRVAWHDISRTRLLFSVNEHELTGPAQRRLDSIARYAQQDPLIRHLFIDGHADGSGDSAFNLRLSKHRAEAVAAYLEAAGIEKERLVVRYHGEKYPVADNQSADGKAQNRRTTVRLERGPAELALEFEARSPRS